MENNKFNLYDESSYFLKSNNSENLQENPFNESLIYSKNIVNYENNSLINNNNILDDIEDSKNIKKKGNLFIIKKTKLKSDYKIKNKNINKIKNKSIINNNDENLAKIIKCSCAKNNCKLKYCNCYKKEKKCNEYCKCLNCKNKKNINSVDTFKCCFIDSLYIRNNILYENNSNNYKLKKNYLNKKRKIKKNSLFNKKGELILNYKTKLILRNMQLNK